MPQEPTRLPFEIDDTGEPEYLTITPRELAIL